jgi:DNA-binding GntR family transcriptional regulator
VPAVSGNGQPSSQFHRANEALREWILAGKVAPNEHLTEIDLAQALEVSRTTVRAVLLDLKNEGFVTLEPNRGARVRSFGPEEAREILMVRERLEGIAAGLAAENVLPEELDAFDDVIARMAEAEMTEDPETYADLSRRFHTLIVHAARNRTVARFIEQTRYQLVVRQFWNRDIAHPRPESLDEHKAILVAVRSGDSVAAERMMRLHVSSARSALTLGVAESQVSK